MITFFKHMVFIGTFLILGLWNCHYSTSHMIISQQGESDNDDCKEKFKMALQYCFEKDTARDLLILDVHSKKSSDTLNYFIKGCLNPLNTDSLISLIGVRLRGSHKNQLNYNCTPSQTQSDSILASDVYWLRFEVDTATNIIMEVKIVVWSGKNTQIIRHH